MKKLGLLSLFSGVGAFESALERLGVNFELIGFSEIDKYAIESYCAIHNIDKTLNLGDISKVEDLHKFKDKVDLIVGGSPCQDFSIAGNQQGCVFGCLDCGSEFNPLTIHYSKRDSCPRCNSRNLGKTRSSLLIEYLRTIMSIKPKYFIYENVKNIIGTKFKDAFDLFNTELQEYGYNTCYQVLNAKDYGIPQNRERVFVVGIREDVDRGKFEFSKPFDSGLRLKDLLEDVVDEKYYIENEKAKKLLDELKNKDLLNGEKFVVDCTINDPKERDISNCITSRQDRGISNKKQEGTAIVELAICAQRGRYGENGKVQQQLELRKDENTNALTTVQKDNLILEPNELQFVGGIGGRDWVGDNKKFSRNYPQGNRVYDVNGVACSQTAQGGGIGGVTGLYLEEAPNELKLFTNLEGGKWDKIHESARRVYDSNGLSPTVPTCGGGNIEPKTYHNYKIRKLTPLECWRLMGFTDADYFNAKKALEDAFYKGKDRSNSQMYKQAGNSIVVDVLMSFCKYLFEDYI